MGSSRPALATALLALAVLTGCVTGGQPVAKIEDQSGNLALDDPDTGVVIFRVKSRVNYCGSGSAMVFRAGDPVPHPLLNPRESFPVVTFRQGFGDEFGLQGRVLPAGDYVLGNVSCSVGRNSKAYHGAYARFSVRPGEVILLGVLDYKFEHDNLLTTRGTMTFDVKPFEAADEARLAAELPGASRKATTRLMVPVEPRTRRRD